MSKTHGKACLHDTSPEYNELTYAGGSTSATKHPQKHDRLRFGPGKLDMALLLSACIAI